MQNLQLAIVAVTVATSVLGGCSSSRTLSTEPSLPAPPTPSRPAINRYELARVAALDARRRDLCPVQLQRVTLETVIPYLRSAAASDPMASPFLDTVLADSLVIVEGEGSNAALAQYQQSVDKLGDWWPTGWLGVARCKHARGDFAGARAAMERARLGILKLEERLVLGPDLPPQRNFFEIIGLLPPSPPPQTANARTLEVYHMLVREHEMWEIPVESSKFMSAGECVQRLKSRLYLLESRIAADTSRRSTLAAEHLDTILIHDPNFIEARVLKVRTMLAAGEFVRAWELIAPYVDATSADPDTALTRSDARFLHLAARVAAAAAAQDPRRRLDGNDPTELAEQLFASAYAVNRSHFEALAERAENSIRHLERNPTQARRFLPFIRGVLAEAQAAECRDASRLADLEARVDKLESRS